MNVNGVSAYSQIDAYSAYQTSTKPASEPAEAASGNEEAAVYEKSSQAAKYKPNMDVVEMLKADQETYQSQLMSFVQQAISGQGNALASADDVWSFLASGNFTVTEAAKVEAQKSLEEGGYWSVDKTSDRILEMAKALTGGDPSKIDSMRNAFEKGFKEATKAWGRELPEISSKTYDAVMEKFDKWAEDSATTAATI